jgi:hypothetical protein
MCFLSSYPQLILAIATKFGLSATKFSHPQLILAYPQLILAYPQLNLAYFRRGFLFINKMAVLD